MFHTRYLSLRRLRLIYRLRDLVRNPPKWLRWIEMIAIIIGMAGVSWEFWYERPAERELQNTRLHVTVASLSAQPRTAATSHAVRKILTLMHRRGIDMTGISFSGVTFRMAEIDLGDRLAEFDRVNWSDAHMHGVAFVCSEQISDPYVSDGMFRLLWMFSEKSQAVGPQRRPCVHLRYAHFDRAFLQNVEFQRTDLSYASFTNARLTGFKAEDVNFSNARFVKQSDIESAITFFHFSEFDCDEIEPITANCAKLRNVGFVEADLRHTRFVGADISNTDFTRAKLNAATFECRLGRLEGSNRESPCKVKTSIERTCFSHTALGESTFSDVAITNSDFSNARLDKAVFTNVMITNGDFSSASLEDAEFKHVTFRNVVFPRKQENMAIFDEVSRNSLNRGRVGLGEITNQDESIC